MTQSTKIPWNKIKTEYITKGISHRDLAKKYNCSAFAVSTRSSKENWVEQRENYKSMTNAKAVQKVQEREATRISEGLLAAEEASEALMKVAMEIAQSPKQFYRHVVKVRQGTGIGEYMEYLEDRELKAADTKRLKDLAAGLEIAARLSRTLKGILDEPAKQRLDIERERLEIERKKANQKDTPADGINIIMDDDLEAWSE